jgi:hypothetical protein
MKMYFRLICVLIFVCFTLTIVLAKDDNLKIIKAQLGGIPDLSEKAQKNRKKAEFIRAQIAKGELGYDQLTPGQKEALESYDETCDSIWDIIGNACSWYCGGGPYYAMASSIIHDP